MGEIGWHGRRVFVTGATGFLGGWFIKHILELGAEPICLVRDHVPQSYFYSSNVYRQCVTVSGDLSNIGLIERAIKDYEVTAVVHLAARAIVRIGTASPVETFESNIRGTWNLLEACRISPDVKRVVIASSDKCYGPGKAPYSEDMPMAGLHPYDVSKSCCDLIAQGYAKTYGMPITIVRCGNLYGGGDLNFNRIIPGTIKAVIENRVPEIRSDGKMRRDYLYVEDAIDAYMRCVEANVNGPFNFGTGKPLSVLEVVKRVLKVMGSKVKPSVLNIASNEIKDQWLDCSKAHKVLGWVPSHTFEAGLIKTVEYYRERPVMRFPTFTIGTTNAMRMNQ